MCGPWRVGTKLRVHGNSGNQRNNDFWNGLGRLYARKCLWGFGGLYVPVSVIGTRIKKVSVTCFVCFPYVSELPN